MHDPSVTSKVGNISNPSDKHKLKISLMPVCTSTLSCSALSPVILQYALSKIIHQNLPESTGATRPIADSPKSGSKTSSNASLLSSRGTALILKLAGIKPCPGL
ncbi:Os01g0332150 [Oryza sativa Japonica Group]|uniref:Os01g0332150 protein n=1 Tax=Oryza sativa subsp. japonica TaxID=39947 RepID=A0A0P0V248_ORYSJ|nr:hypothetical protein EE612_002292 [Oryza sativa]BAS71919.1 Os01g0332150 [Oryza sativa Japonica Group]